jgi:hypothetical protein
MKTAHVGLGISDADFDAVELLAILDRTRADVVEKTP